MKVLKLLRRDVKYIAHAQTVQLRTTKAIFSAFTPMTAKHNMNSHSEINSIHNSTTTRGKNHVIPII